MVRNEGQQGTESRSGATRRTLLRAAGAAAATGLVGTTGAADGGLAGPVSGPCTTYWTKFDGSQRYTPFFPDQSVAYWLYSFEITQGSEVGIRFSGEFPESRYMSFTAYSTNDRDIAGAMRDEHIEPTAGRNPFRRGNRGRDNGKSGRSRAVSAGVPEQGADGTYSVAAVPHDSDRLDSPNTFALPEPDSSKQLVWILYRIYLPDRGQDDTGGVGLPRIEAFDDGTGEQVRCPAPVEPTVSTEFGSTGGDGGQNSANPPAVVEGDRELSFVLVDGDAYFGNDDTAYLAAPTNRAYGSLAAVRWRAPTHAETFDVAREDYDGQVRYWSMSVGELSDTSTNETIADHEVELVDGYAHLLCGPEALRSQYADIDGLNYLSWNGARNPVLIYRNQIPRPTFDGRLGKCETPPAEIEDGEPAATPVVHQNGFGAENYIGEYAPTGRHYRVPEFDPESFIRGAD